MDWNEEKALEEAQKFSDAVSTAMVEIIGELTTAPEKIVHEALKLFNAYFKLEYSLDSVGEYYRLTDGDSPVVGYYHWRSVTCILLLILTMEKQLPKDLRDASARVPMDLKMNTIVNYRETQEIIKKLG